MKSDLKLKFIIRNINVLIMALHREWYHFFGAFNKFIGAFMKQWAFVMDFKMKHSWNGEIVMEWCVMDINLLHNEKSTLQIVVNPISRRSPSHDSSENISLFIAY